MVNLHCSSVHLRFHKCYLTAEQGPSEYLCDFRPAQQVLQHHLKYLPSIISTTKCSPAHRAIYYNGLRSVLVTKAHHPPPESHLVDTQHSKAGFKAFHRKEAAFISILSRSISSNSRNRTALDIIGSQ